MINFGLIFVLLLFLLCGKGETSGGYGGEITPGPIGPKPPNEK